MKRGRLVPTADQAAAHRPLEAPPSASDGPAPASFRCGHAIHSRTFDVGRGPQPGRPLGRPPHRRRRWPTLLRCSGGADQPQGQALGARAIADHTGRAWSALPPRQMSTRKAKSLDVTPDADLGSIPPDSMQLSGPGQPWLGQSPSRFPPDRVIDRRGRGLRSDQPWPISGQRKGVGGPTVPLSETRSHLSKSISNSLRLKVREPPERAEPAVEDATERYGRFMANKYASKIKCLRGQLSQ